MSVIFEKNRIVISGDATFESVPQLWKQIDKAAILADSIVCVLQVKQFDSALLSLLVECKKKAQLSGTPLKIENASTHLMALSKVCGVHNFLFNV